MSCRHHADEHNCSLFYKTSLVWKPSWLWWFLSAAETCNGYREQKKTSAAIKGERPMSLTNEKWNRLLMKERRKEKLELKQFFVHLPVILASHWVD